MGYVRTVRSVADTMDVASPEIVYFVMANARSRSLSICRIGSVAHFSRYIPYIWPAGGSFQFTIHDLRFCELAASLFDLFVFVPRTEKLRFLEVISKRFDHLNSPLRIWLGTKMFLYCDNIEDVETVLMSPNCIDRDDLYQYLNEALGVNGIFTLKGAAK